ncbi:hypothetical protein FHR24_001697 [Wenyingzhuangia heitensis]|uniref:Uncharacterized protein n=1 Tax=Wenyingzhuangia heitensis TaxID=1487859 RepID=A0ABX0UAG3_9FLAO|nr:hypothetical protein [Wenyingzhuangia heitensis]NIJ45258.1 hypothetical protein [Wenyingzhuangia heitensis]
MKTELTLHQQRKNLNRIYDKIINQKELPEQEFDELMGLWISKNEKLEEKEHFFEISFFPLKNNNPNNNITA